MSRFRDGSQHGFSLLELLVAFVIMAMSLTMLYKASGSSARATGVAERQQGAVMLAESLLSVRDGVPPDGWRDQGESAGYQWTLRSAPFVTSQTGPNIPRLHEIEVLVSWTDGLTPRQLALATLLPERRVDGIPGGGQ